MLGRPVSELFSMAYDGDSAHDRDEESSTRQQTTRVPPPREDDESPLDIVTRTRQLTASNADDATLAFLDSSLGGIASRYEQDGPYAFAPRPARCGSLPTPSSTAASPHARAGSSSASPPVPPACSDTWR
ncbi:hypothetical protein ABZV52_12340 [Streptomyces sp. NPDC004735]|uniref:hypothetical protein n=1 Tax=Streptomyces sp. NPDC004735 TaxID=3156654 RepID=UPI0033B5AD50